MLQRPASAAARAGLVATSTARLGACGHSHNSAPCSVPKGCLPGSEDVSHRCLAQAGSSSGLSRSILGKLVTKWLGQEAGQDTPDRQQCSAATGYAGEAPIQGRAGQGSSIACRVEDDTEHH